MSRFDENTTMMRQRRAATLIHLLKPELEPQTKVRGIGNGVLLGAIMWVAIIALGIAIWRLIAG